MPQAPKGAPKGALEYNDAFVTAVARRMFGVQELICVHTNQIVIERDFNTISNDEQEIWKKEAISLIKHSAKRKY